MAQPLINISSKQAYLFALFLVLYEFLTYIANDMIMPGMIQVTQSFHAPETAIATSLTAYILGGASLQLFLGPLSDYKGRRPVMIAGAILFFLFTVLIACSNSINQFLIARFCQGMGLCFIAVIGYATLQEIFSEMDAIRLIALMASVSVLAPLLGPVLGALVVHYFNWRWIFVVIAGFSLLALWGLWRFMPEPVGQTKTDGLTIPRIPFTPKIILNNYKKLLSHKTFMLGCLACGLQGLPCVVWIGLSPVILVLDGGLSIIHYGLWQLPVFGACIFGYFFLHRLTHRYSVGQLIGAGSTIMFIGLLSMLPLLHWTGNRYIGLMPGIIIYFFGGALTGAPLNRFLLFTTPVAKGTASAIISLIGLGIQALGLEIGNHLYTLHHSNTVFAGYCGLIGGMNLIILSIIYLLTMKQKNSRT